MFSLIKNARILTMNEHLDEYEIGWVLIEGNHISALGSGSYVGDSRDITHEVDASGKLLMPGMINTHTHMAMSLFRGLGEDLDNRLEKYIFPLERDLMNPEMVRCGTELAAAEMLLGGVTTLADMYYFESEVGRVIDRSGLRAIVGQTLGNHAAPDHKDIEEGFARVDELRDMFAGHERITPSIAPHAPYTTGAAILERVAQYGHDNPDVFIQMHLAEMKSEMEWSAREYDCRPIELAHRTGILQPGSIFAHCLEALPHEIELLAQSGCGVAHNPRANAKAGRGIAPVEPMQQAGIAVGLGTDGPMSSNTLDIFSAMAPASMFAKLRGHTRKAMPAKKILQMATIDGARALGLSDQTGSVEVGKAADLILLDLAAPRITPLHDIYAATVFSMLPTDVSDVMIDGSWCVRNRELQTLDLSEVRAKTAEMVRNITAHIN